MPRANFISALALAAACASPADRAGTTDAAVTPAAGAPPAAGAATPLEEGPLYVDVRTPAEYQAGHVPGALLIPLDQLAGRVAELEPYRGRQVVLYCRSGRRAGEALALLQAQGFTKIENGGGLSDMEARGLALTTE